MTPCSLVCSSTKSESRLQKGLFMSVRSYLPIIFTAAVLLPCTAFANTAKGTAVIIHNSVSGMDNQILYSSFYSADDGADEASTVFFNDGFGRLTAFEKEYKDGRMTIIIRQNMNVVWKNTYTVSSNHFSVERIDTDGHILFRIHVGERILVGEIDSRDRWIMTEPRKAPRDETMIPLASAGTADVTFLRKLLTFLP